MDTLTQPPLAERGAGEGRSRVLARWLGTALMLVGAIVIAWSVVVWRWNDPVTALYTHWQQAELRQELDALHAQSHERPKPSSPMQRLSQAEAREEVRRDARNFRTAVNEGNAIGRLVVPRLDLDMVVVDGTSSSALKRGPGLDRRTFMPGEGELSYIAGHRTTYGAPFAHIDRLRPNDTITVVMPYGTLLYRVTRHRIVDDQDLSVLRSRGTDELALQACHPRFFATRRYIVWATLRRVTAS